MNPSTFKVAMLHISQNQEDTSNEDPSVTENILDKEKLTLTQKKKIIEDSLDSYYSPVINAYLRKYDNIGQLVVAALSVVSQFGDDTKNLDNFEDKLGNFKVKILNAVGDTAMEDKGSLKETFLNDPETSGMGADELDDHIRSFLGDMRRDTMTKVKKIQTYLVSK